MAIDTAYQRHILIDCVLVDQNYKLMFESVMSSLDKRPGTLCIEIVSVFVIPNVCSISKQHYVSNQETT